MPLGVEKSQECVCVCYACVYCVCECYVVCVYVLDVLD